MSVSKRLLKYFCNVLKIMHILLIISDDQACRTRMIFIVYKLQLQNKSLTYLIAIRLDFLFLIFKPCGTKNNIRKQAEKKNSSHRWHCVWISVSVLQHVSIKHTLFTAALCRLLIKQIQQYPEARQFISAPRAAPSPSCHTSTLNHSKSQINYWLQNTEWTFDWYYHKSPQTVRFYYNIILTLE